MTLLVQDPKCSNNILKLEVYIQRDERDEERHAIFQQSINHKYV